MSLHYDFDIHPEGSYMYFWTKNYMDATYKAAKKSKYDFKNKTLLDIGVGRGRSFTIYSRLGIKNVIGFDVQEKEAALARKQSKRTGIPLDLTIDDEDNNKLKKLKSNSFDVITLMNILFCVPNEQVRKTIVQQAIRLLKPGGRLIILDMQRPSLMSFFSRLTGKPWVFRSDEELLKYFSPLTVLTTESSNYFYFINKPLDVLNSIIGSGYLKILNRACAKIGIPASTKTFILCK